MKCLSCDATLRACKQCDKPFPMLRPDQEFCGRKCKNRWWYLHKPFRGPKRKAIEAKRKGKKNA